ncbi:MAG: YdcF family protein [Terriglobia bacterium]
MGTILANVFSPVNLLTGLFLLGLILEITNRKPRWGRNLLRVAVLAFVVMVYTPFAEVIYSLLWRGYPAILHPPSSAGIDRVVVLGAYATDYPGTPITSNVSQEMIFRLCEGIRLYRLIPHSKLILSGGEVHVGDGPIAKAMADFATALGVPVNDIEMETKSTNTYENLFEVHKLVGDKPFYLVTSATHIRRAMAVASSMKMQAVADPTEVWTFLETPPPAESWGIWSEYLFHRCGLLMPDRIVYLQKEYHEIVGLLWYHVRHRS